MSHLTFADATHQTLEAKEALWDAIESGTPPASPLALASPHAPPADKTVNQDLVARLKVLVDTGYKGKLWSRNALARAIGTNTANVSIYLRQDSPSAPPIAFAVAPFEAKARDFLTTLASKRDYNGGIIATGVVTRFASFVDMVRATNEIGFYYGPAGLGKSTAIESYAASSPAALVLTATKWQAGAHGLTSLLGHALRITATARSGGRAEAIAARLKDQQSVILIDNAHRLTHGAIEFLFDLYDITATPIVFVGNHRFLTRLSTDDQLFSRLFHKMEAGFKDGEGRPHHHAIHAAADAILKRELPDHFAELKTMARKVAREPGHLRALVKRCRCAAEYAALPDFQTLSMADCFRTAHATSVHPGYSLEDES